MCYAAGLPDRWPELIWDTVGSWHRVAAPPHPLPSLPVSESERQADEAMILGKDIFFTHDNDVNPRYQPAQAYLPAPGPLEAVRRHQHPLSSQRVISHVRLVCLCAYNGLPLRHGRLAQNSI